MISPQPALALSEGLRTRSKYSILLEYLIDRHPTLVHEWNEQVGRASGPRDPVEGVGVSEQNRTTNRLLAHRGRASGGIRPDPGLKE